MLHLENNTVQLLPPVGGDFPSGLLVAGAPAKKQLIPVDPDDDKNAAHLTIGTLNMYVIRRGDRLALRVKDSKSPALVNFHDAKWYPPDAAYHVSAAWVPYSPQKTLTLTTLVGTTYDAPVPGAAEFTLDAKTFRLEPVPPPILPAVFFIPSCRITAWINPVRSLSISTNWKIRPAHTRRTPLARCRRLAIDCRSRCRSAKNATMTEHHAH